MIDKWICTECRFIGGIDAFDRVEDPGEDGNMWTVCPSCRAPEHVTSACDEPGCTKEGDCGFPTPDGSYRRTCFEHSIFSATLRQRYLEENPGE
jgi:hypothetical protein